MTDVEDVEGPEGDDGAFTHATSLVAGPVDRRVAAVARVATVSTQPRPGRAPAPLVTSDPGRPRMTVYDDTDSPTRGERIELSARVLANWVAKAANLLQDDLDVGPARSCVLDLPPHWRTLYWALAVWSVGGCVEVPPTAPDAPCRMPSPAPCPPCRAPGALGRRASSVG